MEGQRRPEAPPHETVLISDLPDQQQRDALRQQCYDVRFAVFITEQGSNPDLEVDEIDRRPQTQHLLLRLTDDARTPIGTLRIYPSLPSSDYAIGRVVVLKEYRAYGFGGVLIRAAHERILAIARANLPSSPSSSSPASDPSISNPAHGDPAMTVDGPPGPGSTNDRTVSIKLGSQIPAMGFYARYGYVQEGEEYLDGDVPHRYMRVRLPL